jgi:hypothetical protein
MLRENLQLQSQIGGMLVNQVYRRSQLKYWRTQLIKLKKREGFLRVKEFVSAKPALVQYFY